MKKRVFSLALALLTALSLMPSALAAPKVVLSPQNLAVNGKTVACEKYNIDGANYFKLRDVAALLSGTASQFAVGYDEASKTITVTTGKSYAAVGGELKAGVDNAASAVVSAQKLLIDGRAVTGLSVYNIGGSNFFKLRDLGAQLGFAVDYDAASNTAKIASSDYQPAAAAAPFLYDAAGENDWYYLEPFPGDEQYRLIGVFRFAADGTFTFYAGYLFSEVMADGQGTWQLSGNTVKLKLQYTGGASADASYTLAESGGTLVLTQTSDKGIFGHHGSGFSMTLNKGCYPESYDF